MTIGVKKVSLERSVRDQIYLPAILDGLLTTARHFFRNTLTPGMVFNGLVPLLITLIPGYLREDRGVRIERGLTFLITAAVLVHAVGALGQINGSHTTATDLPHHAIGTDALTHLVSVGEIIERTSIAGDLIVTEEGALQRVNRFGCFVRIEQRFHLRSQPRPFCAGFL